MVGYIGRHFADAKLGKKRRRKFVPRPVCRQRARAARLAAEQAEQKEG
jgi:hypothetical protein